jgi:pheromone shutdown protein TraB
MILVCKNAPKQLSHLSGIVSSEFRLLRICILLFILILAIYICTIHYFLIPVEYTRKVRANYLVSLMTLTTCILACTHSTVAVYAEESDVADGDEEISNSVRNLPSNT